ncbi:MAG: chemotaxis protein CheX [Bacillota bacterium]
MAAFQHIDSFIKAAHQVIEMMLTSAIEAGKPYFNEDPLEKYEISVVVGVLGDLQGQVICGMNIETARKIIKKMLYYDVDEIDEMGKSAICELKNIIIGTASTNLSLIGYRCTITPPIFLTKGNIPDFLKHIHTSLAVPIRTDIGDIDINVSLRKDDLKTTA